MTKANVIIFSVTVFLLLASVATFYFWFISGQTVIQKVFAILASVHLSILISDLLAEHTANFIRMRENARGRK
jgi:Na+-translocating ferredoxin:NAD+ oxidoreductase RnfD subunit